MRQHSSSVSRYNKICQRQGEIWPNVPILSHVVSYIFHFQQQQNYQISVDCTVINTHSTRQDRLFIKNVMIHFLASCFSMSTEHIFVNTNAFNQIQITIKFPLCHQHQVKGLYHYIICSNQKQKNNDNTMTLIPPPPPITSMCGSNKKDTFHKFCDV